MTPNPTTGEKDWPRYYTHREDGSVLRFDSMESPGVYVHHPKYRGRSDLGYSIEFVEDAVHARYWTRCEAPLPPLPTPGDQLAEAAEAMLPRLENGEFFQDYDGDLKLMGNLRRALTTYRKAQP